MDLEIKEFVHYGENVTVVGELGVRNHRKIYIGDNVILSKYVDIVVADKNNEDLNCNLIIKNGAFLNNNVKIEAMNHVELGNLVIIGPDVYISDMKHEYSDFRIPIGSQGFDNSFNSRVVIKDGAWIGANSTIVGNITVGYGSVVGSNSTVTKDIPNHVIAVGVPATIIKACDYRSGEWIDVKNNNKLLSEILQRRGAFIGYEFNEKSKETHVITEIEEENYRKNIELFEKYQNIKIKNMDLNWLTHKIERISKNFVKAFVYKENGWKSLSREDGSEINEFVNEIDLKYMEDVIIVFGFGMGYHIATLQKKYPNNKILILECDFEIIKLAALYGDLDNIICNDKVSVGLFKNYDDLNNILNQYFGNQSRFNFIATSFSNYSEVYYKEFEDLVLAIGELKSNIEKNRQERIKLSEDILNRNYSIKIINEEIDNYNSLNKLEINFNITNLLEEIGEKNYFLEEGINCLNDLYEFFIGTKNVDVEKTVNRFNQIELKVKSSPILLKVMDKAMYKYIDILGEDNKVKIRVDDTENNIQAKKIIYNLKIYKYRAECMKKLMINLDNVSFTK